MMLGVLLCPTTYVESYNFGETVRTRQLSEVFICARITFFISNNSELPSNYDNLAPCNKFLAAFLMVKELTYFSHFYFQLTHLLYKYSSN